MLTKDEPAEVAAGAAALDFESLFEDIYLHWKYAELFKMGFLGHGTSLTLLAKIVEEKRSFRDMF